MAISLISSPEPMSLAYNPIYFVFDSTNKAVSGMRYVVDVYLSGTSTKVAELFIAPDPTSGYAVVNLQGIVKNLLSNSLTISNTSTHLIPNMFTTLDIKVGEALETQWNFNTVDANGAYARLNQSPNVAINTYIAGDIIEITSSPANAAIDGIRTVVTRSSYTVTISAAATTSATGGATLFSNGTKVVTRDLYTYTALRVYRGCLSFKDFITYDEDTYKNSTTLLGKFLTTIPRTNFSLSENSTMFINVFGQGLNTTMARVYFENSNGDVFYFNTSATNAYFRAVACGIANLPTLTTSVGTAPLIKDDTTYYKMWTATSGGVITSEVLTINIDRRCKLTDYEILFMDKLGSFIPFSFSLREELSGSVERSRYEKELPSPYTTLDGGTNTFYLRETQKYKLGTNYMTDEMSQLFKELIATPYAYLLIDGSYYLVDILDSSYTEQRQRNKNLIRYDLNVQLANKVNTNG
jgi:hypothetical protein